MPITIADHSDVIRDLFDKDKMLELTGDQGPVVTRIKHEKEWSGDHWRLPLQYGTNQNVSGNFARMITLDGNNLYEAFVIDPFEYFGRVLFSRRFLKSAKGENAMVYLDGMEAEWTGLLHTMVKDKTFQFYGDGSGCRGRLTAAADPLRPSNVATQLVYLQAPSDSIYFEVGMTVTVAAARTGGAERAGQATIASIDPVLGALTCVEASWDDAATAIPAIVAQDFIYRAGDYDAVMPGVGAWIPPTAPVLGVPFNGVDRAVHATKLSGNRLTVGALTIAEAYRQAAASTRLYGSKSTYKKDTNEMSVVIATSLGVWGDLETELHTQGMRDFVHDTGEFGYSAIRMRTQLGKVDVVADPFCPGPSGMGGMATAGGLSWLLDIPSWKYRSAGEAPEIIADDNNQILRQATTNDFEGRAGWIMNLGNRAPGNNCVISH